MKEWHYQVDPETEHGFIDCGLHKGCESRGTVQAPTWLQAKQAFGFELTPVQKELVLRETHS